MRVLTREERAAEYADKELEKWQSTLGGAKDLAALAHKKIRERWLANNPGYGPGEEDGPWAEGWGERAGEPLHREWRARNLHMLSVLGPDAVSDSWQEYKRRITDGVALQAAQHPFASKSDAGKPKIFQFFLQQFPLSMGRVADHMEAGCRDPGHVFLGWQDVENGFERYTDAMLRHLLEEVVAAVTDIDRKEGVDKNWIEERQAVAVAANSLIRLELLLRRRRSLNLDAEPGP